MEHIRKKLDIDDGRNLMLELGQGLGNSEPPHDVARNHDMYFYT